jgi:alkyl hydroperoxide reductase subunit AhpC
MSQSYDVFSDERGTSVRSVFIIDKEGIIRFSQVYDRGLPDAKDILGELEKIQT